MNRLKILRVAAAATALTLISACGGGHVDIAIRVNFSVVDTDDRSGIHEGGLVVIRSAADWSSLWAKHKSGSPGSSPAIDFSENMAVGVFLGVRPLGCYSVAIRGVVKSADKIAVQYKETTPPFGMACTTGLVYPSQIVTIPASTLSVEFTAVD